MQRERTIRRQHNDSQDALLLCWVLIFGIVGILYFLAYNRLHIRAGQLVEITIYPLLAGIFAWEVLRWKATKTARMEQAWPRPIPFVSRKKEEQCLREAERRSSVLLGYDIFGEPFYWSNETRTMQSNAFGMTGAGKTNLLENVTEQDIRRGVPDHFYRRKGR